MTPEYLDFQVKLWDAVNEWASGTTHIKIKAVAEVNRLIAHRPCPGCGLSHAAYEEIRIVNQGGVGEA